jgi:hypothetical protein
MTTVMAGQAVRRTASLPLADARPSTSFLLQDVDARHKAGHDEFCYRVKYAYAGLNPACVSAARASSDASTSKKACTAGRCLRAVTSAKS